MVDLFFYRELVELNKDEEAKGSKGSSASGHEENNVESAVDSSSVMTNDVDWETDGAWDPNESCLLMTGPLLVRILSEVLAFHPPVKTPPSSVKLVCHSILLLMYK